VCLVVDLESALGLFSISVGVPLVITLAFSLLSGLALLFEVDSNGGLGLRFETKFLVAGSVLTVRVIPVVAEATKWIFEEAGESSVKTSENRHM